MTDSGSDKAFDFEKEVIETYRLAKDDVALRIKALDLLAKVIGPAKKDKGGETAASAVLRAQAKINGRK